MDKVKQAYKEWMTEHNPPGGYWDVGLAVWVGRQPEIDALKRENQALREILAGEPHH